MGMHNAPASWIGIDLGLRGPNLTYSTACSSSAVSIGEAFRRVRDGDCDAAIAGGTEAPLSPGSLKAWEALRTLAAVDAADPSASCKPFSADRSGMVLGEGAAMLVLEPWERAVARGATIHGEVIGYGLATDIAHITRPSVDGQAAALRAALASAGIDAAEVDAINAHGTGTQANDGVETAAVRAVFGDHAPRMPLSSTKSMHGHLLGAAGALECVLSLLAMREGVVLPTMQPAPARSGVRPRPRARRRAPRRRRCAPCCPARSPSAGRTRCWRCARRADAGAGPHRLNRPGPVPMSGKSAGRSCRPRRTAHRPPRAASPERARP